MRLAADIDILGGEGSAKEAASGIISRDSCLSADDEDADTLPTVDEQRRLHGMTVEALDAE
eukprot:3149973-Prymnesium_polylepis.1